MTLLRFAPIVRVSTEAQKKRGESLRVQKEQITKYVELLGGVIPPTLWAYSGQEHATPDQERRLLDKLLADSNRGMFDAVIVVDPSRWSRDNLKNKEGLKILKASNIRFFVGTMEYDLHDPEHEFILGLSAEMNERQAKVQNQKAMLSKIRRAEQGVPTNGKLPYGRTFDKKTRQWGIDKDKQRLIIQAAKRYLSGEGIPEIARTVGLSKTQLRDTFNGRCGTEWSFSLKSRIKSQVIEKTYNVEVPRLLPDDVIKAIRERARNNICSDRGNRKYEYLLTGFVFCNRCGYHMGTRTNNEGRQYYRHSQANKDSCSWSKHIPAKELESSVLITLVKHFGDPVLIRAAIEKATPDMARIESLINERGQIQQELVRNDQEVRKLVMAVRKGTMMDEDVRRDRQELQLQEDAIKARLSVIDFELSSTPDPEKVHKYSQLGIGIISAATRQNPKLILKRGFQWRRKLVERAFSGFDATGKHYGIYIDYVDGKFTFEIRGQFENTICSLPMSDTELIDAFHVDTENQDYDGVMKELQDIRDNIIKTGFSRATGQP